MVSSKVGTVAAVAAMAALQVSAGGGKWFGWMTRQYTRNVTHGFQY